MSDEKDNVEDTLNVDKVLDELLECIICESDSEEEIECVDEKFEDSMTKLGVSVETGPCGNIELCDLKVLKTPAQLEKLVQCIFLVHKDQDHILPDDYNFMIGMIKQNIPHLITSTFFTKDYSKFLKELSISEIQLSVLPEEIGLATLLETLLASKNQLKRLPHTLSKLKKLTSINVESNLLETLPSALFWMHKSAVEVSCHNNPFLNEEQGKQNGMIGVAEKCPSLLELAFESCQNFNIKTEEVPSTILDHFSDFDNLSIKCSCGKFLYKMKSFVLISFPLPPSDYEHVIYGQNLESLENRKVLFEFPVCSNKCAKTYGNNPSLICDTVD